MASLALCLLLPSTCSGYQLGFPKRPLEFKYLWSAFCSLSLISIPESILHPWFLEEEIKAQRKSDWSGISDNFTRSFLASLMSFTSSCDLCTTRVGKRLLLPILDLLNCGGLLIANCNISSENESFKHRWGKSFLIIPFFVLSSLLLQVQTTLFLQNIKFSPQHSPVLNKLLMYQEMSFLMKDTSRQLNSWSPLTANQPGLGV